MWLIGSTAEAKHIVTIVLKNEAQVRGLVLRCTLQARVQ